MIIDSARPPRIDVHSLYPHFYAEKHKHHVRENQLLQNRRHGSERREDRKIHRRPLSRHNVPPPQSHAHHKQTATVLTDTSTQCKNQQEAARNETNVSICQDLQRPLSRHIALRGELSLTSLAWHHDMSRRMSPRLHPLSCSTPSLLEATTGRALSVTKGDSLVDFVVNTRPRSRLVRRARYCPKPVQTLARISTAPTPLCERQTIHQSIVASQSSISINHDTSSKTLLSTFLPPICQTVQSSDSAQGAQIETKADVAQDEDAPFFLTELEAGARSVSTLTTAQVELLAKDIALGSFLLYGEPSALVAALQHLTRALKFVGLARDTSLPVVALKSLLHHHLGVAFREFVVASVSGDLETNNTCIQSAFAAQRRALDLAQQAKDFCLQARAIKALGVLLLDQHAYEAAHTHQQAALHLALNAKDRELEARVYANLGNLALAKLDFNHALSCHSRDLHLCAAKELDSRVGRARAHRNLSLVYAKLHRCDQQLQHENEAIRAAHGRGGAFAYDLATHRDTSVGNICLQPTTTIDAVLVTLVSQNLAAISCALDGSLSTLNEKETESIVANLKDECRSSDGEVEAVIATIASTEN